LAAGAGDLLQLELDSKDHSVAFRFESGKTTAEADTQTELYFHSVVDVQRNAAWAGRAFLCLH